MPNTTFDTAHDAGSHAPQARQRWLALLARATRDELDDALARCPDAPEFVWLRAPQTGLVLVQGRVGGSGDRFNLGETTLTRCTLRQRDGVVAPAMCWAATPSAPCASHDSTRLCRCRNTTQRLLRVR